MVKFRRSAGIFMPLLLMTFPNAACAHKELDLDCRVEGAKYLTSDLNEAQLCDRFVTMMGDNGQEVQQLHIVIRPVGSISVQWSLRSGDKRDIGLDVMDRGLKLSDLDRLAKDAGQLSL